MKDKEFCLSDKSESIENSTEDWYSGFNLKKAIKILIEYFGANHIAIRKIIKIFGEKLTEK